jgi:pyruvate dehydrogenase E1 component alpha subunit
MTSQVDRPNAIMPPAKPVLHEMLSRMMRIRMFEERVATLKEGSALPGAAHLSIGQEAAIVGACMALGNDDYMTGTHRSHGHPIGKGAALGPLMAELYGKRTGVCKGKGGSMHLADFSVGSLGESGIVGGLIPIAVGAGLSAVMRGTRQVCLCFFGDGAVNEGVFHESLNLASVWKLPVIFLCENNGYAMFTPSRAMSAVPAVAERAAAYAMPGVSVDGQEALDVYEAVAHAAERARDGLGPTLIEARTYRYCDHSEFGRMNVPNYRTPEEVESWRARDPLDLFAARLTGDGSMTMDEIAKLRTSIEAEVDEAVRFAEASPDPAPEDLTQDIFA